MMDFATLLQPPYLGKFIEGTFLTIELTLLALLIGFVIALPTGILASSKSKLVNFIPKAYIYFFRGSPLLVQIYMIYYGVAQFGLDKSGWLWQSVFKEAYWCALIAFALNTAAYSAEIIRGCIIQTPSGEVEAAKAYGMTNWQQLIFITLPSALRRSIPAYANEAVFMLHGTSVVFAIRLVDVLNAARFSNSRTFLTFESFILAGMIYLVLSFLLISLFRWFEKIFLRHLSVNRS